MERKKQGKVYDSVGELAIELGISRQKAYEGLNSGAIPAIRLQKRFIIPRAAIEKWLQDAGGRQPGGAAA
jgi:excisionase family DNA binding protein